MYVPCLFFYVYMTYVFAAILIKIDILLDYCIGVLRIIHFEDYMEHIPALKYNKQLHASVYSCHGKENQLLPYITDVCLWIYSSGS